MVFCKWKQGVLVCRADKLQDEQKKRLEAECAAGELTRRCANLQMQLQLEQQVEGYHFGGHRIALRCAV